ncbi:MAG: hypothetical protein GEU99_03405 [Luteitalea sp.]|nr:hypothetical protein [Luteitalea sp.]
MHSYLSGVRAASLAALAYAAAFFAGGLFFVLEAGRSWPGLLVYTVGSGLVVFVSAAVIQVPVLTALGRRMSPSAASAVGAALAVVPFAILVLVLRDGSDPRSVSGFLQYWRRVPGEFFFTFAPMSAAGAILGWLIGSGSRATS